MGQDERTVPCSGWFRMDQEVPTLPVPAVYLPADDLYQGDLAALGFVSMRWVALARGEFSRTRHVLADVSGDPNRLTIFLSRHELYSDTDRDLIVLFESDDVKVITGVYANPADRAWRRRAQRARQILILAGPPMASDELPATYLFHPDVQVTAVALTL